MSLHIRFGPRGQVVHTAPNATSNLPAACFTNPRIRASIRHALADEIDRLLILIDMLDGDADLEPDADNEPSLGWSISMAHGTTDDAEQGEVSP